LGANSIEVRGLANPFPAHSPRPFVSSDCLPPDYLRARESSEQQGDISDYPPKALKFGVSKEALRTQPSSAPEAWSNDYQAISEELPVRTTETWLEANRDQTISVQ
jgi:hypothetical protein